MGVYQINLTNYDRIKQLEYAAQERTRQRPEWKAVWLPGFMRSHRSGVGCAAPGRRCHPQKLAKHQPVLTIIFVINLSACLGLLSSCSIKGVRFHTGTGRSQAFEGVT